MTWPERAGVTLSALVGVVAGLRWWRDRDRGCGCE